MYNLPPSEFWNMHPDELWWLVEAKLPQKKYGSLTEDEVAEIYEDMLEKGLFNG